MRLELLLNDIENVTVRENFERIQRFLFSATILNGDWQFLEVDLPTANTAKAVKHHSAFVPKDILLLNIVGDHRVYFNYQIFDSENVYVTNAGPCKIRFLAGVFRDKAYGNMATTYPFVAP